jgi:hypothetical protein
MDGAALYQNPANIKDVAGCYGYSARTG